MIEDVRGLHAGPPMPTFTPWASILADDVALKALAQGMPELIPACSGGHVNSSTGFGIDPRTGEAWQEGINDAVGVERTYRFLADTTAIALVYKTRTEPWGLASGGRRGTGVHRPEPGLSGPDADGGVAAWRDAEAGGEDSGEVEGVGVADGACYLADAAHGVEVRTSAEVVAVRPSDGSAYDVLFADGTRLGSDVVIAAAGAEPAVAWLADSGLLTDGKLLADSHGRVADRVFRRR